MIIKAKGRVSTDKPDSNISLKRSTLVSDVEIHPMRQKSIGGAQIMFTHFCALLDKSSKYGARFS